MIPATNRPKDATTIFMPDIDLAVLEEQIKQGSNNTVAQAAQAGEITLSIVNPTQSGLGSLKVVVLAATMLNLADVFSTMRQLEQALGRNVRDIKVFGSGEVEMTIEEYQPSAFKKQIQFAVNSLGA